MSVITDINSVNNYNVDNLDEVLAKRACEVLEKHYPNHLWAVHINSMPTGGVMYIKNFNISFVYGMVLHLRNVYADPQLKCVVRMGGELLERARLKRGRYLQKATILEGAKAKYQPRKGLIV